MVNFRPAPPQGYDPRRAFLIGGRGSGLNFDSADDEDDGGSPPMPQITWVNGPNSMFNGGMDLVFRKGGV